MKKAFTLVELLVIIAIAAICLSLIVGVAGGCSVSDGNRVGTITKFSHKGFVSKSWEGEMALEGLRSGFNGKTSTIQANVWPFTVTDPEVVKKINEIMDNGHRVKLTYHQSFGHNPFVRDTSYTVTGVVDLEATPEKK